MGNFDVTTNISVYLRSVVQVARVYIWLYTCQASAKGAFVSTNNRYVSNNFLVRQSSVAMGMDRIISLACLSDFVFEGTVSVVVLFFVLSNYYFDAIAVDHVRHSIARHRWMVFRTSTFRFLKQHQGHAHQFEPDRYLDGSDENSDMCAQHCGCLEASNLREMSFSPFSSSSTMTCHAATHLQKPVLCVFYRMSLTS